MQNTQRVVDYIVASRFEDIPAKARTVAKGAMLDCLGVAASDAFAIEDSPNGVMAAKRAGLRCVAIPNSITARLDLTGADVLLRSLAEITLADLLKKIEAA